LLKDDNYVSSIDHHIVFPLTNIIVRLPLPIIISMVTTKLYK